MGLYAIGDTHGCHAALQTLLDFVPLTSSDQLIMLGDYIDRGPQSRGVIEWVMEKTNLGECIPLRGNHEIMMLDAFVGRTPLQYWLQFGGQDTLNSYSPDTNPGRPEDIPVEHLRFLDLNLLPYYETETHVFVHATLDAEIPLRRQSAESLYWERFDSQLPLASGKTIVCGHTAQKSGRPNDRGYAVCIDTWVYGRGWLTCLNVATGQYWQANQAGQTRTDWLERAASP